MIARNREYAHLDVLDINRVDIELWIQKTWGDVYAVTHHSYNEGTFNIIMAGASSFFTALTLACPYSDLRKLSIQLYWLVVVAVSEPKGDIH